MNHDIICDDVIPVVIPDPSVHTILVYRMYISWNKWKLKLQKYYTFLKIQDKSDALNEVSQRYCIIYSSKCPV